MIKKLKKIKKFYCKFLDEKDKHIAWAMLLTILIPLSHGAMSYAEGKYCTTALDAIVVIVTAIFYIRLIDKVIKDN